MSPGIPLSEVETFSKPGTADVTPADRKKLAPLMRHYAKKAHPFTACKRDQMKHGLSEGHANRRCAVLKDLIRGTTKWRGKNKEEEALAAARENATRLLEDLAAEYGAGAVASLALEREEDLADAGYPAGLRKYDEEVRGAVAVLAAE